MDRETVGLNPSPEESRQAKRLQRVLLAGATSAAAVAITFVVASFGMIEYAVALRFALIVAVLAAMFDSLIRSGLNLRFADPSLAMPMAVATGIATSYVVFEGAAARPAFLAFYLMALMFSVFFLEGPRLVRIALFYFACYATVIGLLVWLRPETTELRREVFRLVIMSIIFAWFGGIGWHVGRLRRGLRRANTEITRLNREQRLLFDTANVGIALIRDRVIVDCNQFLGEMLGYRRDELIGSSTRIYHPDDASWEETGLQRHAASVQSQSFREERVLQRKDGEHITCDVAADTLVPGRPELGIAAVFNDVTARRKAEADLRKALLEQVAIFENAVVGIAFTRDRTVLSCNSHMSRIFGYDDGEMIGLSSRVWFPSQESWEERGRQITAAFARGDSHTFEEEFVCKDGRRFWCSVSGAAVDPNDPVSGEGVFVFGDVTARKRHEEEVERLARVDALTGLPNRRTLDERLRQAIAHARRQGSEVAVMLFDLDGFKQVNDTRGHAAGDEVLVAVARRLDACFREVDTVARLGGDEFVAILGGRFGSAELSMIAEKAAHAIAEPIPTAGGTVNVGASIGVAVFPGDAEEPDVLLARADKAMYGVKARGGGYCRSVEHT